MEKQVVNNYQHHQQHQHNNNSTNNSVNARERHIIGEGLIRPPQLADSVLQWGSRKRLRCMKIQVKDEPTSVHRTTVRVDRRVVKSDDNNNNNNLNNANCVVNGSGISNSHGHFNLRQRRAAATPVQTPQRILRNNSESGSGLGMKGSNGVKGMVGSPERGHKKGSGVHQSQLNINNDVVVKTGSLDKGGGGSSSGGSDVVVWPPKFMIALTNKEKEEDFMAIKGSKLPQRPKKRAKYIQRTLNLVSPGGWLCDLTLERYEVRERKTTKKRPRGLKAMGNYIDSDSD